MSSRRPSSGWLLVGPVVVALGVAGSAWAAGRAPQPVPSPSSQTDWSEQFRAGTQAFRQRQYAQALAILEPLARQHPDDPWLELYLRIGRRRVEQPVTALVGMATPPPQPAILRVLGLPPVVIRPMERPPAEPPAAVTAESVPAAADVTAAGGVTAAVPGAVAMPVAGALPPLSDPDAPPVIPDVGVPYPQDIPLPPPGPLSAPGAAATDVPVQAHADVIEFSPELQRVMGRGHVRIMHEGQTLTCDRVVIFTKSRDALAEGHVRLEGSDGVLTGDTVYYNFATKKGTIITGGAEFFPWYSRSPHMVKTSEHTMLMRNGYITTCDLDPPHYRMQAKEATIYLNDKVVAKHVRFYVGRLPLWYFPRWKHSLRENRTKFALYPGKKKPWGVFLLGKYRYEINANAKGNIHWDWRENFGHAVGLDLKYVNRYLGYGLFRVYYNEEPDRTKKKEELLKGQANDRYRVLLRHRWDIDESTNLLLDFQKYGDVDFRRDFLFREEFQVERVPETYALLTRTQPGYTFTALLKKRVNRYEGATETLPELKFDLRERRVRDTRLYYDGDVTVGNYNKKTAAPSDEDTDVSRVDVFNQLRYAMRWFRYFNVTPFISSRQTYYSKDRQGGADRPDGQRNFIRSAFSQGVEVSTKVFRMFDTQTDVMGLNIRRLRHIITPTIRYEYTPHPTVPPANLPQFDSIDAITRVNRVTVGLENKLQAQQMFDGQLRKTDIARLLLSIPYDYKQEAGSAWGELIADMELLPFPWLRFETDLIYDHVLNDFKTWNMDIAAIGSRKEVVQQSLIANKIRDRSAEGLVEQSRPRWTAGVGHRYEREVRSEMTAHVQWQPHPKWWLDLLGRYTYKDVAASEKRINSLREFQIIVTRDLHDWLMQVTVGEDRDLGGIFLVSFVLKAFPESPIALDDEYHRPKAGSQSSAFYSGTSYYGAPTVP